MRLLLDSNALYRFVVEPERLGQKAFEAISSRTNDVHYSAINLWELAIKRAKGKMAFEDDAMLDAIANQHFIELPIMTRHGLEAAALPPHHADPFDRMLIAQARLEGLTLVTSDKVMQAYRVVLLES